MHFVKKYELFTDHVKNTNTLSIQKNMKAWPMNNCTMAQ